MRSSRASSRSCATAPRRRSFPAARWREKVTQAWREKFASPLPYVGGGEFATNNIAVYSPDRPRVIVHADLVAQPVGRSRAISRRRGAVLVWEDGQVDAAGLAQMRSNYPGLDVQEPISLPRQSFVARGKLQAGARALRHRAAEAWPHDPESGTGSAIMRKSHSGPTASPSISTLRSGPASPAITR